MVSLPKQWEKSDLQETINIIKQWKAFVKSHPKM